MFVKSFQYTITVFSCNFDDGKCPNGNFHLNQSTVNALFLENQLISGFVYRITDVTSISILENKNISNSKILKIATATTNGKVCDIPFREGNLNYNHCYKNLADYGCPTKYGGEKGICTLGKYEIKFETIQF